MLLQDLKPPLAQESPRTASLAPTEGTQERELPFAHFRTPKGDSRENPSIVLGFRETLWKDFYMTEVPSRDVPVSLLCPDVPVWEAGGPKRHLHPNPQNLGRLASRAEGFCRRDSQSRWGDHSGLSGWWANVITRILRTGLWETRGERS